MWIKNFSLAQIQEYFLEYETGNFVRTITYTIPAADAGMRVQTFLQRQGYSVRLLRSLKQIPEAVLRDGVSVRMVDQLAESDILTVLLKDEGCTEAANTALSVPIVYEDDDVIVYNKPPFLATHPSNGHREGTLAGVYARDMQERGQDSAVFRPVYRLDRDTDGLCVIAKNAFAAAKLAGKVEKEYAAIVCGQLPESGTIDAPIAQLEFHRMKRGVRADGQRAVTHFRTITGNEQYTLVHLRLETGRTHQIRVHFAHIGHPVAGDSLYGERGSSGLERQALTCVQVDFSHPVDGKTVHLCINMQKSLLKLIQNE